MTYFIQAMAAAAAAYGAYAAARAQRQQAEYQESLAEYSVRVAENEAVHSRASTAIKTKQHRLRVAQTIGKQRAAMGASGVVVDEGSFLDLTLDTVEQGKMDELALLYEGELDVWRINVGKGLSKAQAKQFGYAASQSRPAVSGVLGGLTSGANFYASGGFGAGDSGDSGGSGGSGGGVETMTA